MDLLYRGINSSGPERRLFLESRETSCRPSSLQETGREVPVSGHAGHPGWSIPTLFPPTRRLTGTSGPYVAVWRALVWPRATLQAGHLDLSSALNLDSPRARTWAFLPPSASPSCPHRMSGLHPFLLLRLSVGQTGITRCFH